MRNQRESVIRDLEEINRRSKEQHTKSKDCHWKSIRNQRRKSSGNQRTAIGNQEHSKEIHGNPKGVSRKSKEKPRTTIEDKILKNPKHPIQSC